MELPPVVLQSVGDTYNISAGFQTDWRLCGQQQTALKKQLLLLKVQIRGEQLSLPLSNLYL